MEYCALGNLHQQLDLRSGPLREGEARDITAQILDGLIFMHDNSFAHRDLKPQVRCHSLSPGLL